MEKVSSLYNTIIKTWILGVLVVLAIILYTITQTNKMEDMALSHNAQITRDYLAGKPISGNEAWWISDRSYAYEKNIARELNMSDKELAQKLMGENYVITIRPMSNGPAPTH